MIRTHLPFKYNLYFCFLIFLLWFFEIYSILLFTLAIYGLILFFLRKYKNVDREDQASKADVLFSPVAGKVISITERAQHRYFGKNLLEVRIMVSHLSPSGIFLPATSEVHKLTTENGESFYRYFEKKIPDQSTQLLPGLCLQLKDVVGSFVGLQFLKCKIGLWPEIKIMPGDRGRAQSNIGYFPLGGTVLIYLPNNCEILVNNQEHLVAGVTLIAGYPKKIKSEMN